MLDILAQTDAFIFGVTAIILVSRKNKWGFVAGLLGQPGWLITTVVHQQWGIFLLSLVYTFSWTYGFYQWFIKNPDQNTQTGESK